MDEHGKIHSNSNGWLEVIACLSKPGMDSSVAKKGKHKSHSAVLSTTVVYWLSCQDPPTLYQNSIEKP